MLSVTVKLRNFYLLEKNKKIRGIKKPCILQIKFFGKPTFK